MSAVPTLAPALPSRELEGELLALVGEPGARTLSLTMSKDPNAKLTVLVFPAGAGDPALVVKVPTTARAAVAVAREHRLLLALHALDAGPVLATVPAVAGMVHHDGLPALVTSALPGTPLRTAYYRPGHTGRPAGVAADLAAVGAWLGAFQSATAGPPAPIDLGGGLSQRLRGRFGAEADEVGEGLEALLERLGAWAPPSTAVHGDLWFGNVLTAGQVTGVVDWEAGAIRGDPVRDLARFVLAYALYLDRHTRPGRRVRGHPGLRATRWGAGVAYALDGTGWFPGLVRRFLSDGLRRLGLPGVLWRDAALAGLADVAVSADHADFALAHLRLLRRLLAAGPSRGGGR
jgi:aminoglycoside phosphotransferase (APT) family kinase protein